MIPHFDIRKVAARAMFCVLTFLSLHASAREAGWYPGMYLAQGDGLDLYRQNEPKLPGAIIMSQTGTTLNTGYQSEIVTFAQSSYDMVKTLSVNSSVSLDYLVANADITASFFGNQTFDANDVKFIFTKTRNFGTTLYSPVDFSPSVKALIASYQTNWQGEALHSQITSAMGTHYVAGFEKSAMVSVVYTFHFASASTKQQFSLSASGSSDGLFTSASFSAYVSSFFRSATASTSMNYQFYSTDPSQSTTNLFSGASGSITSYQQFTNFLSQLEAYGNAMDPANAKITGYLLNPIQTVPGYLSLLGGYVPPPEVSADYNDFLQAYAALQVWQQRLEFRGPMTWLNAKGQQVLSNSIVDINNYLSNMQSVAVSHFNAGTPLDVPPDVVAYLANLSQLRLPEIYVMDNWVYYDSADLDTFHVLIGRVDCGNSDLIAPIPFGNVAATNVTSVTTAPLYYSPSDFIYNMTNTYTSGYHQGAINKHLKALFASEQWNCLTNSNPDVNGFFVVEEDNHTAGSGQIVGSSKCTVSIYDPISHSLLDRIPFFSSRSGGCLAPSQLSGGVSVSVAVTSPPTDAVVGLAQPVTLQITNQTPVQAYGTTITFVLSNAFDFGWANGSQGYASFDPSTRIVSYVVGPLPGNASADISLNIIPLQNGLAVPGSPPVLAVGAGLTNSATGEASFSPIVSALPTIGLGRTAGGVQLDWWSDTDRVLVESSSTLGSGASWSPLTSGMVVNGSHRFQSSPISGRQAYFRLHSQ